MLLQRRISIIDDTSRVCFASEILLLCLQPSSIESSYNATGTTSRHFSNYNTVVSLDSIVFQCYQFQQKLTITFLWFCVLFGKISCIWDSIWPSKHNQTPRMSWIAPPSVEFKFKLNKNLELWTTYFNWTIPKLTRPRTNSMPPQYLNFWERFTIFQSLRLHLLKRTPSPGKSISYGTGGTTIFVSISWFSKTHNFLPPPSPDFFWPCPSPEFHGTVHLLNFCDMSISWTAAAPSISWIHVTCPSPE